MEVMKQLRQRAIRDLVEQRPIRTQQELAAALRDRGFRATQATISRDVAELQLVKVHRDGVTAYALPPRLAEADPTGEERLRRLLRDLPVELREAGHMLVLVTLLLCLAASVLAASSAALEVEATGRRSAWRSCTLSHRRHCENTSGLE